MNVETTLVAPVTSPAQQCTLRLADGPDEVHDLMVGCNDIRMVEGGDEDASYMRLEIDVGARIWLDIELYSGPLASDALATSAYSASRVKRDYLSSRSARDCHFSMKVRSWLRERWLERGQRTGRRPARRVHRDKNGSGSAPTEARKAAGAARSAGTRQSGQAGD